MPVQKIWKINEREINDELLKFCDNNKILAKLLVNRGITSPEKAGKYLNPLKCRLSSPDLFSDMQKSVERIQNAIDKKEHITVYGDFDADGITSTSILYLTLKHAGADVDYYLPDRATESHGLNTKALVQIISKRKTKLIITVDCGISNVSEVRFAKTHKTDVIITDHHEAPDTLPDAYAILNPKAKGAIIDNADVSTIESLNYLAGAGVAFKLACKILETYKLEDFVHEILPLVALGTIGDIVELKDENRTIAAMGLELIRQGKQKGLQALLKISSVTDISSVTSDTLAFQIVPKINAAGRLESPETAIKVLISDDDEERSRCVNTLADLNAFRQNLCDETFEEAKAMYEAEKFTNKSAIVLLSDNWHIGIIGIVCSKLVEEYNKPAFLMTRDANNPELIRCSCRSIKGINVHDVLSLHKDLFEGFGGHKMAAGFSFNEKKLSFDKFKSLLIKSIEENSTEIDFSKVVLYADMELSPEDITIETVMLQDKLQPFGADNPAPVFVMNDVILNSSKMMGQNSNHLKMFVQKNGSKQIECVKWNCDDPKLPLNSKLDLLFSLKTNTFNDVTSTQLLISDIHSDYLQPLFKDIKILDHRRKKDIFMQVADFLTTTKKTTAVFVRNPELKKKLKQNELSAITLFSDVIPSNIQQLMFFDIPDNKELYIQILKKTSPEIIHIMNFGHETLNTDLFIAKISGMLKYALNNLYGEIDLARMSDAAGVSQETVECVVELLETENSAAVERLDSKTFKIKSFNPAELSKLRQNELVNEIDDILEESNKFKSFWLNAEIDEIKALSRELP